MNISQLFKIAYKEVNRPKRFILLLVLAFIVNVFYPSDLDDYSKHFPDMKAGQVEHVTENYVRFVNTALQIGLPVVLGDKVGLVQLIYVATSATILTHGMKRLVNDWHVMGTRLGQRPSSPQTKHNMPSGHSSMASCAMYFICRRYSFWFAVILVPIMLLTMYTRVMLHDHTISAVLAGALAGILAGAMFTSRWQRGRPSVTSQSENRTANSPVHH
jgi:membrane-associated phospholipid phosphatase